MVGSSNNWFSTAEYRPDIRDQLRGASETAQRCSALTNRLIQRGTLLFLSLLALAAVQACIHHATNTNLISHAELRHFAFGAVVSTHRWGKRFLQTGGVSKSLINNRRPLPNNLCLTMSQQVKHQVCRVLSNGSISATTMLSRVMDGEDNDSYERAGNV